jgi:hypothetical protein
MLHSMPVPLMIPSRISDGIAEEIERVLDQNEEIDPAHLTGVLLRLGKSELSLRQRLPL